MVNKCQKAINTCKCIAYSNLYDVTVWRQNIRMLQQLHRNQRQVPCMSPHLSASSVMWHRQKFGDKPERGIPSDTLATYPSSHCNKSYRNRDQCLSVPISLEKNYLQHVFEHGRKIMLYMYHHYCSFHTDFSPLGNGARQRDRCNRNRKWYVAN